MKFTEIEQIKHHSAVTESWVLCETLTERQTEARFVHSGAADIASFHEVCMNGLVLMFSVAALIIF